MSLAPIVSIFQFSIPTHKMEPAWSSLVERWYQLDLAAFALASASWEIKNITNSRPDLILLASPEASNQTDFDFVKTGGTSASKFVHTLPSVRGTSIFQIFNWNGPVLCLQNGPSTLLAALAEAMDEWWFEPKEIWLFSVLSAQKVYFMRVHGLSSEAIGAASSKWNNSELQILGFRDKIEPNACAPESGWSERFDSDLLDWIRQSNTQPFVWNDGLWERTLNAPSV